MEGVVGQGVKRRRHLSKQAWGEVLQRFAGAGVSVEEFCRSEGLCRSSFNRWRSRLGATVSTAAAARKTGANKPVAPFVDLGVLGASAAPALPALDLRIDLGGGVSLHLVRR